MTERDPQRGRMTKEEVVLVCRAHLDRLWPDLAREHGEEAVQRKAVGLAELAELEIAALMGMGMPHRTMAWSEASRIFVTNSKPQTGTDLPAQTPATSSHRCWR